MVYFGIQYRLRIDPIDFVDKIAEKTVLRLEYTG